ncbi:dihydrolipoamide acetyltransferase family protein [Robertmurraya sp. FSL W8-0741]|uniref:dihydrolipoamide acetyltransferase family protein n=1 Tax=Robertmurraya sp. FSL W8-0741 TaxID=2954629 RepID=UPI001FD5A9FE|nr:dihydrolipoamide acetyltransferase family protein [Robertmurraya siralis]
MTVATNILMPKLGLTMTEGTVESWYKKEGDAVKKGDIVCTISSEKLTHDVEAPEDGILLKIFVEELGQIPCKEPIGCIGELSEKVAEASAPAKEPALTEGQIQREVQVTASPRNKEVERIFITPIARKIAAERGIDYSEITGTGGNGRITRHDVENFVLTVKAASAATNTNAGQGLSGMRKVIAKRMHNSLQQTAQVTLHRKANVSPLMTFRTDMKAKLGDRLSGQLSINTLLARAVVLALKDFPEMNASYANGEHVVHEDIHIGMAVAVDEGLIVPVVKDAANKTLTKLAENITTLISGARSHTLSSDLLTGSTFTISNLGYAGIEYFTPILNTPEIGILGVGAIDRKLAFSGNKEIVEQQELPLSLTFDHQVVDGALAAEFLQCICTYLENPYLLLF